MHFKKLLTTTSICAAALCGAMALGIHSNSSPGAGSEAAVAPIAVAATTTTTIEARDTAPNWLPAPTCVLGWSKNSCNGTLRGHVTYDVCRRVIDGQHVTCRTAYLKGAEFIIPVRGSGEGCSPFSIVTCDRTPQLDGRIALKGDFVFDLSSGCNYRGAWEGEWRLIDNNGAVVASGSGTGTLGTGSHRAPTCFVPQIPLICGIDCEGCYDVQQTATHQGTYWHVGIEGNLQGEVFAGELQSSEVRVMLSGTINTRNPSNAEPDLSEWIFCGATDGVVLSKCSN